MHELIVPAVVERDLRKLPRRVQDAIIGEHFPRIAADPHANPFLHGDLRREGLRKYKFNAASVSYRIIYRIVGATQVVVIVMLGSRQSFYAGLRRRLR